MGTLPDACHAAWQDALTESTPDPHLDYPRFAEPLRDCLRENAGRLATTQGVRIAYIANAYIRKEDGPATVVAASIDYDLRKPR